MYNIYIYNIHIIIYNQNNLNSIGLLQGLMHSQYIFKIMMVGFPVSSQQLGVHYHRYTEHI